MTSLSHINKDGDAEMVDVSSKGVTTRIADAVVDVLMQKSTLDLIYSGGISKGDVLSVARIAGIQGAKRTSELIPLCHPLAIAKVDVNFLRIDNGIRVSTRCKVVGRTGVEMEALTAASIAALTIYDMCKAVDRGIRIHDLHLVSKTGGQSGDWSVK